jgi:hypothetical protein
MIPLATSYLMLLQFNLFLTINHEIDIVAKKPCYKALKTQE